jgi:hypothetical protein
MCIQDVHLYGMRTNNYIESFHHHLKTYYLTHTRKQPVDVLLYILSEQLLPDMHRADLRVRLGFESAHLNQTKREARKKAQVLDSTLAQSMVEVPVDATEVRPHCRLLFSSMY